MNTDHLENFESYRKSFDREFFGWQTERYAEAASPLNKVIRYVLEGQGKRVRPILSMLSAESVSNWRRGLLPGFSVEMTHIYSLVHDDLPCMDDDAMRRGRPTAHVVFDEASALLAGDAILADSFALLVDSEQFKDPDAIFSPEQRLQMTAELARAAGSNGMCRGQALDLHWTGKNGASKDTLDQLHHGKTGLLLGAACAMGAIAGGADSKAVEKFRLFGCKIGLAFQIIDDLMDSNGQMGKTPGKDAASGKLTYLTHYSADEALRRAKDLTSEAVRELESTGLQTENLIRFAMGLLDRTQ
jgi:geranylgeranyl pyrophosphate synthase